MFSTIRRMLPTLGDESLWPTERLPTWHSLDRVLAISNWTPSDWIALVSVVALLVTNVGNLWWRAHERADDRRAERTRAALAVSGPLSALVFDMSPMRLTMLETSESTRAKFTSILERWESLRESVWAVQQSHHDADVRDHAERLVKCVNDSLVLTSIFASNLQNGTNTKDDYDEAMTAYTLLGDHFEIWVAKLRS
jgi:hypothetical protein